MMAAKSYYMTAHIEKSFQNLNNLRKIREKCDIHLLVSNKEISAHKVVLASGSLYFKNAIYGLSSNGSGNSVLEVNKVQYEILCTLVNFMYTGKVDLNYENVYDIYKAADYYLMNLLIDACLDFMEEILNLHNCVKIWIIANNIENKKLLTAAGNFIFKNMEIATNNKEFFTLSSEGILDFFKRWPKHELFDRIISSVLKWAANKRNWEKTVITILNDIPHTKISKDYFENFLIKNEIIENSNVCHKWVLKIAKEKSELENEELKLKLAESEARVRLASFLFDQPVIFISLLVNDGDSDDDNSDDDDSDDDDSDDDNSNDDNSNDDDSDDDDSDDDDSDDDDKYIHKFHKYNHRDGRFRPYNSKEITNDFAYNFKPYKDWIYAVGEDFCDRFIYDDADKNGYELAFRHNHGQYLSAGILNDSMYIFGGESSKDKASRIDLNTKQTTSLRLLYYRKCADVAVIDGSLYICGGRHTDVVERLDPREGLNTEIGKICFNEDLDFWYAAALSNELYISNGMEYKLMDLRNNSTCMEIEPPVRNKLISCLFASCGKIYTVTEGTIYEYINVISKWQNHGSFPELNSVDHAITYQ